MSDKSSLGNNFQDYVEAVKQRQMTWNIFQNSVEDFSHSDIYRLKLFNAILLTVIVTVGTVIGCSAKTNFCQMAPK